MKTMKWLVRREYWEHRGMFFWAPLIAAGLIVLAVAAASFKASSNMSEKIQFDVNGHTMVTSVKGLPAPMVEKLGDVMSATYMVTAAPLIMLMTFTLFFYCLGAMYDERRDRSILFWKSLPVSDTETVASKVGTALVVAPLLYIGIGIALALVTLLLGALTLSVHGINLFPTLFSNSSLYLSPLMIVGLLPVYALWALPTVGWLMMVSSWARSKVFLWAVGVPLMALAVLAMLEVAFSIDMNVGWFAENIVARGLGSIVPGSWMGFAEIDPENVITAANDVPDFTGVFTASWATLTGLNVWIGAVVGAAMIAVAVRMRRWRDEG
jgi:ABC-2 type transport system permease protein